MESHERCLRIVTLVRLVGIKIMLFVQITKDKISQFPCVRVYDLMREVLKVVLIMPAYLASLATGEIIEIATQA